MKLSWAEETLAEVGRLFDVFSKTLARRVAGEPPAVQLAQNAVMIGFLRRMTEYLEGTFKEAPEDVRAKFKEIEQAMYEKVVVVPYGNAIPGPFWVEKKKE